MHVSPSSKGRVGWVVVPCIPPICSVGLKVHPLSSCVVSCSLDGTVRSWHLESMTEVTQCVLVPPFLLLFPSPPPSPLFPLSSSILLPSLLPSSLLPPSSSLQCYRLDCGEPLLGLSSDFPLGNKLVCHAHQTIRMWVVNQVSLVSLLKWTKKH